MLLLVIWLGFMFVFVIILVFMLVLATRARARHLVYASARHLARARHVDVLVIRS